MDARSSSGEGRPTLSAQGAELAGAVRVPNALHTAAVVADCSISTGAVRIGDTRVWRWFGRSWWSGRSGAAIYHGKCSDDKDT